MDGQSYTAKLYNPEDLPENILTEMKKTSGQVYAFEGRIYLALHDKVCCLPDDSSGREFAFLLKQDRPERKQKPQTPIEIYDRILNDPSYLPDAALARQYGIGPKARLCVMVLRSEMPPDRDLASLVSAMAPIEDRDGVVPLDYRTSALVRDLAGQTAEEMAEYAEAVIGTMETEGYPGICAGIGGVTEGVDGLRRSLEEGKEALTLGKRYHRQDSVFVFGQQTLEKIVDAIPAEQRGALRRLVFGENGNGRLSDEMLDTVRVFFDNDLNLTAASKQLFIHRNTLNYRLDKIKKDFGLDLRSFRDAVIFKIVSEMTDEPRY